MDCPSCGKQNMPDTYFCHWCGTFIPVPEQGTKAGLFRRYFALAIDPIIACGLYFLGVGLLGSMNQDLGITAAIILPFVYLIWYVALFRKGQTPGKKMLSVRVVKQHTGRIPGFGKMLMREVVGKTISALFFSFGFFAAIFDKDNQAWHDKMANTVVLKVNKQSASFSDQQQQPLSQPFRSQRQAPSPEPSGQKLPTGDQPQARLSGENRSTSDLRQLGENVGQAATSSLSRDGRMPPEAPSPHEDEEWLGDEYWDQHSED